VGGTGGGSGGADASAPDAASADASTPAGDGGGLVNGWDPGVPAYAGKAGIYLCPKAYNQQQCCQLLCACNEHVCGDSPMDKPRLGGCMAMCMNLSDARARCQVYHCFESSSPSGVKDHASHCGHASGRVGGGGCPAYTAGN
jgi:hypothetical protein